MKAGFIALLLTLAAFTLIGVLRSRSDADERQHCVTTGGRVVGVHGLAVYPSNEWICDRSRP